MNLGSLRLLHEGGFIPGVVADVGERDPVGNVEGAVDRGAEAIGHSGRFSDRLYTGAP